MRMLLIFKNSIKLIIIQKSSRCKQSILGMLLLLCSTSTYATTEKAISSVVASVERRYNIPKNLLLSIAKVESGFNPFALNIEGKPILAKSKEEAINIVQSYLNKGVTNIDIGLFQINFHFHGENFTNVSELLDTNKNLDYAASFLRKLYKTHGSWREAVQRYHSARPEYHRKYARKVLIAWLAG